MSLLKRPHQANDPFEYDRRWVARVMAKTVALPGCCIVWIGDRSRNGYGQTSYRGKTCRVHRIIYQVTKGVRVSRDLHVCHTCDVKTCVNVRHLWVGTHAENQRDKAIKGRVNYSSARYAHCKRGHEFTSENTRYDSRGFRQCRMCARRRLRIKAGWPADLAASAPKGHRTAEGKPGVD